MVPHVQLYVYKDLRFYSSIVSLQPSDFKDIIRIGTHLALENLPMIKVKTVELIDSFASTEGPLVSKILVDVLGDLPLIQVGTCKRI